MTARPLFRLVAVTALLAAGCGSGSPPSSGAATPTSTTSTTASLALVTLRGSDQIVVQDLTDINHAKTLAGLGTSVVPLFVSATEVSYADDTGLVRSSLDGNPKTTVVYTTESAGGVDVHQLTAGVDRVLGSAPSSGVGGCETIAGCAITNSLDFRLAYSPDGAYVSVVVSGFAPSTFRLWSSNGNLLRSNDSDGTTMSVWSGSSLYFRDSGGVEVWRT